MTTENPFFYCDNRSRIGGFVSLLICESKNVIQQEAVNTSELPELVFLYKKEWLAEFGVINKTTAELKLELQSGQNGNYQSPQLKFIVEQDISPQAFQEWFQKNIQGRNLVVQLVNNNDIIRTLNPLSMTYNYIGTAEHTQFCRYELVFNRAKMLENTFAPIYDIAIAPSVYPKNPTRVNKTKITIILNDYVDPDFVSFKFSSINNIDLATPFNRVSNLTDGIYYIFIVLNSNPEIFQTHKLTVDSTSNSVITLI